MMDRVKWPGGASCAVMLTFDFDAETLWLARDPANAQRPGVLSQGTYGSKVGVPKIVELLDEAGVKGTFFVPGWTAERHTARVELILEHGHEIGHHSYDHVPIKPEFPEKEEEDLLRGLDALKRTVGVVPRGYRSPAWDVSANMLRLLANHGFAYDSSMMDQIDPYRLITAEGAPGPVELPVHWSLDDAPFALFSIANPRTIVSNEQILRIWQDEFREIHRWGGLFNLTMHPQVIGRPSRIALLSELIGWIRAFPGVWFARGGEVADAWAAQEGPIAS
jgi:peptidoglycan/xylan/chitin deacetylase (PgdA/CDA1 family)